MCGDYWKCCVWTAPRLDPFPTAVMKRKIYALLFTFLASTTPHSKVSLLQSWHSRGNAEKQKFLRIIHGPSLYLNRVLLFVCCSKFSITLRNIQLFGDRNTFIAWMFNILHICRVLSILLNLVISQLSFVVPQGRTLGGVNEGRWGQMEERNISKLSLQREF